MITPDSLIDFIPTKYYFDTFILGSHHSTPHLIYDLQKRKELVNIELKKQTAKYRILELNKLSQMIDNALSNLDIEAVNELEDAEQTYWINQLARQSSLEVSTYGRIRPETMNLLMCLPEEDFIQAMSISGKLTNRIQQLGDNAMSLNVPIPSNMPIVK